MGKAKTPKWIMQHAQKCRVAFGVGTPFTVALRLLDTIEDDPGVHGQATTNYRYLRATVELRRDLEQAGDGPKIITHEFLHVAQHEQHLAIARILDLVPKKQRAHAQTLWDDHNERYVEQMAQALTPLLQGMQPVEDDHAD